MHRSCGQAQSVAGRPVARHAVRPAPGWDFGQYLTLADRIASTNRHRVDAPGKLRGHLNRAVTVVTNLAEHLQRGGDFRGTSSGERDATLLKLRIRHGHAALNLLVTERIALATVRGADGNLE